MATVLCPVIGLLLIVAGLVIAMYWQLRFLATAYKFSVGWFFGVLLIPFADWAFALLYFRFARKPFSLYLLGSIMTLIGLCLIRAFRQS